MVVDSGTNTHFFVPLLSSLGLEIAFCAVSLIAADSNVQSFLSAISWYLYTCALLVYPIILVGVDEFLKRKERRWFIRFQKELKLDFETKLGKYSPK